MEESILVKATLALYGFGPSKGPKVHLLKRIVVQKSCESWTLTVLNIRADRHLHCG